MTTRLVSSPVSSGMSKRHGSRHFGGDPTAGTIAVVAASPRPEEHLAGELRAWADGHPGEQADFLLEIANATASPAARAQWSFVDIPNELERRAALQAPAWGVLRVFAGLTYLGPILVTWLHLRHAVDMYADAAAVLQPGQSLDFIAFWSGATGTFEGTTLPSTAYQVVLAIIVIVLAQILSGSREQRDEPPLSSELRVLALRAQLFFFESRAVTPRELADAMSSAATRLGEALSSASTQLASLGELSRQVTTSAGVLETATANLDKSATTISSSVRPLVELPTQLKVIIDATASAADNLGATKDALATATDNLSRIISEMRGASQDATLIAEATEKLVKTVQQSLERAVAVADGVTAAAEASARLGAVVSDHEPHVAILNQATLQIQQSVNQLHDIAKEFAYAANAYRDVNASHRRTESD